MSELNNTNYYAQRIPPVRDSRIVIGDSYSGTSCDLLDCAKNGCLLKKSRSFWQAGSCQMSLTLMMAATVANSVIIMHSPGGCGAMLLSINLQSNKGRVQRGMPTSPANWISTDLKESDVIGGGEGKLQAAIEYADREFRPEIIFVVSTCAPSIIGDDVAEVIEIAKKSVSAKVVGLHCPGFKSRLVASGYDSFYHGLLRDIPLEQEEYLDYRPLCPADPDYDKKLADFEYEKSRTVNLWNATSMGYQEELEIKRLLEAIGLKVQIFAEYSSLEEFRKMTSAALNVSMCDVHDDYILTFLKEKYGIPFYIAGMPVGLTNTRNWLVGIAKHFGLEEKAEKLCDYEEKLVRESLAPILEKLKGKRALMTGGIIRVAAEATALTEVGIEVIAAKLYHYDDNAEPLIENMKKETPQIPVSVSNQQFEMVHQLKTLKPDFIFSHYGMHGAIAKTGIPGVQLFNIDGVYFGYSGFNFLIRKIEFALENTKYQQRISQNTKVPYRDWYFEGDAFALVKD
jgi:nitrogenase molybdenum-iron protein alpha chain